MPAARNECSMDDLIHACSQCDDGTRLDNACALSDAIDLPVQYVGASGSAEAAGVQHRQHVLCSMSQAAKWRLATRSLLATLCKPLHMRTLLDHNMHHGRYHGRMRKYAGLGYNVLPTLLTQGRENAILSAVGSPVFANLSVHAMQDAAHQLSESDSFQAAHASLTDVSARLRVHLAPARREAAALVAKAQHLAQPALNRALPYWHDAEARLRPVWVQTQEEGSRLIQKAVASLSPYVHQISARMSALVYRHSE